MAGLADAHRIAIEGASAGGWTVLAAVTRTDAFGCGISRFGVADARMLAEHTHDFESRYLDGLIGPLPEAEALYDERSPLSHVDELSCPVLLLQGLDDPIVPPAQAERFRDAMAAKGIPHEYIAFAGESHGFRKSETLIRATEAMLAFLGEVFGFSPHHA
jgi:dipeptidyl aminopeptidase/acylaminoacyl peptidase